MHAIARGLLGRLSEFGGEQPTPYHSMSLPASFWIFATDVVLPRDADELSHRYGDALWLGEERLLPKVERCSAAHFRPQPELPFRAAI